LGSLSSCLVAYCSRQPVPVSTSARLYPSFPVIGLGLVSLAGLALEITLTRIFSVLFFYNYVFLLISLAILGIGFGAALVHNRRVPTGNCDLGIYLNRFAWAAGGSLVFLILLVWLPWPLDLRPLLLLAAMIPYGWIGALSASLFRVQTDRSGVLYAADFIGGALGVLVALLGLSNLGGMNTLLALPIFFGLAAVCFHPRSHFSAVGLLFVLILLVQNLIFNTLKINPDQLFTPKPLPRQLNERANTQVIHTRWDAFGRVDVLEDGDRLNQRLVFIDGAAGSVMYSYPQNQVELAELQDDLGYFPFETASPKNVLIIGPGGGKDILFAHLADTQDITAVEISSGIVSTLHEFSAFNGDLATLPGVDLIIGEGRSYLRRSDECFDMIYLSEVTSLSVELAGYMLAENYIYTTEAIHDYLAHLTPDGWLIFKLYDEFTLTRAFTTVVQALMERGSSQAHAVRQVVVVLDPQLVSSTEPFREPLLMVASQPLDSDQGMSLLAQIQNRGFIPVFVPHALEQGQLGSLVQGSSTLDAMITGFERGDVSPTTDNAPFFYEFEFGLPLLLRRFLLGLVGITLISLIYLAWRQRIQMLPNYWQYSSYFVALGIGFLLLEAGVIQRLSLFLGHPTRSLSVVLLALLIGGGVGSYLSHFIKNSRMGMFASIGVVVLAMIYLFGIPVLLDKTLHWPLWGRIMTSWVLLLPLGMFMGVPFPSELRKVLKDFVPLAWGVNGLGTVLGAVGAMALAMTVGFNSLFLVGGGLYLLAGFLSWSMSR
jgi:spermidine synthase